MVRVLTVLFAFCAATAYSQSGTRATIETHATLILIPTEVHTRAGELIYGLNASQFRLTDNGFLQTPHMDDADTPQRLALVVVVQCSRAERVNQFHRDFLNPYLNFHRPCAQPQVEIDAKGLKRRLYRQWLTPLEKLLSLHQPQQYLRQGRSIAALERAAGALSDTEAALRLQRARDAMFDAIAA
jgi:hypothetical protein